MAKRTGKGWLWIVGGIVAGVVLLGSVVGITRSDDKEKTLNTWFGYEVGAIAEDGDFERSEKTNIVSDLVEVKGLKVEVDDEKLSYVVHYYDKDEKYISSTESFTGKYDATEMVIPDDAKYARVEITVSDDDEISLKERLEYLKDVEVKYTPEEK